MACIKVSTEASLLYMIAPGLLVIITPILAGILFGYRAVEGLLAGSIVSGVQVAISASNTGGAWDNAKKETEKRRSQFYAYAKYGDNWPDFKNAEDTKAFVKGVKAEFDSMNGAEKDELKNDREFRFKALAA